MPPPGGTPDALTYETPTVLSALTRRRGRAGVYNGGMIIEQLLGPIPRAVFIEDHYLKLPFARAGGCRHLTALGSWQTVEGILARPEDVNVQMNGTGLAGNLTMDLGNGDVTGFPSVVHVYGGRVRGNVSVLEGSGGNIAVLAGRDGKLLVEAGITATRKGITAALNSISSEPVKTQLALTTGGSFLPGGIFTVTAYVKGGEAGNAVGSKRDGCPAPSNPAVAAQVSIVSSSRPSWVGTSAV